MKPTILWYSYRPGGIDILADSLKHQTHQDYELIMVDDLVERKKDVLEYLDLNGITPAYLGPSKKKCFPEIAYNCTNALNTGILMSTGDPILILTDYIWLHPKAIERFCSFEEKYKQKYCITVPGRMWAKEPYDLTQPISVFKREWQGYPVQNGCRYLYEWVPEKFEMSCSAIPYEVYMETNGCPECWDCCTSLVDDLKQLMNNGLITRAEADQEIQQRLNEAFFYHEKVGAQYLVDKENICEMINHRDWQPQETWHATKQKPQGSTEFIKRENTFNLKTHKRGTLP
jgi:glycosyltransferase involved in cell wall biosynthesis